VAAPQQADEITIPFNDSVKDGLVLQADVYWNDNPNEKAKVEFIRNAEKNDVFLIVTTVNSYTEWGLKGHSRNKHKPSRQTGDHLMPFL
jgi:hypothetical protein